MKLEEYEKIVKVIKSHKGLTKDCAKMLVETYSSFKPETLYSILTQEISQRMIRTHSRLFKSNKSYYQIYLNAVKKGEPVGILLRMAINLNTCPAILAKNVLEEYNTVEKVNATKKLLANMLRDTTLIKDSLLSYEIYMCVLNDDQYGAISTAISDSIGEEYEIKLQEHLTKCEIPFYDENHLRSRGYDKTPDFKLEIPVAVNGFIINWIESKAQFGSFEVHRKYKKEQFLSYWNRFGPGLVIYWFGFLDNIIEPDETRYMVMDHYPENITYMNPDILKEEKP